MRVLVACEFSGIVRDEFRRSGHDAVSCDLLPTETPGPHIRGDVLDILADGWDLMIAHPPCTYLANSGVQWLNGDRDRWQLLDVACSFFCALLNAPIPRICLENPIPHRYAIERIGFRRYSQLIHPWQFGHGETKSTCLWLRGLPLLRPTNIVIEREPRIWKLPPSPDRWKIRSRTYPGIASAMAMQWGGDSVAASAGWQLDLF